MRALRAATALMLLLPGACQAKETPVLAPSGLAQLPLNIITSSGETHGFTVEVARSEEEQAKGLMFRTELAPDAGMIFPMKPARFASFWMKNTLIPLDMIFIRPDGRIANIAAMTIPYSLMPVDSSEPVAAVLEIAGGRAEVLGIKPGDRVIWKHDTR